MTRFDHGDVPLATLIGEAYLALLRPLHVDCPEPLPGRVPYVRTLRQLESRPRAADIEERGFELTQSMPALAVYVAGRRVERRSSHALDWRQEVDIDCFCDTMASGREVRQDRERGMRALTDHVVEHLHLRIPAGPFEAEGIEVESCEPVITTPRVDWWRVRTVLPVRQDIARQRTPRIDAVEFHQRDSGGQELAAALVLDFDGATALIQE